MKTMGRRVAVLGGYGAVGSEVVHLLADGSRQILVAGRDEPRARALAATVPGAVPAPIEVNRPDSVREVISADDVVINCTGVESISLAQSVIESGANYMDISASQDHLVALAALDETAVARQRTILCSVGLAPGLTNLFVADLHHRYPGTRPIDVTALLGLGDDYGAASQTWTLARIGTSFPDPVDGRPVGNFREGRRVLFPAGFGRRRAYRFDLADQHVLTRELQRPVVTRLAFAPAFVTRFAAVGSRLPALARAIAQVARRLPVTRIGTAWFAARVEVRGGPFHWGVGHSQSYGTAVVAACAVRLFDEGEPPPGLQHLHNLTTLLEVRDDLHDAGILTTTHPHGDFQV